MTGQEIVPAGAAIGRPLSYTADIGAAICVRISLGESLRSITADPAMPSQATVYQWLIREDLAEFLEQYRTARELQADTFHDEAVDIADDSTNDYMMRKRRDGSDEEVFNGEHVQRSKLRIETRKWMAEIGRPKKYGPKLQVESRNRSLTTTIPADATPEAAALVYEKLVKGE